MKVSIPHTISRRTFLKTSALAAASTFLITRDLFSGISSNEVIQIGIIGLGRMAHGHVRSFGADERCRIVAVSDVDDARMRYQKERIDKMYGTDQTKTYKDFRNLLADKSIDAVVIVTPDHWHALMSVLAARAGKAIYCEKPLTFTVREGQAVVEAVRTRGVVFQTGSQQRSDVYFRRAAQLAATGMIGEVREVYTGFDRRFPKLLNFPVAQMPEGIDWDMWCGPGPVRPYADGLLPAFTPERLYNHEWGAWRWDIQYGSGMQADWGAHHYDIAMWGLNMDGKGPKYVEVFPDVNPSDPTDVCNIRYVFENGAKLTPSVPKDLAAKAGFDTGVFFVGTEGACAAMRGGKFWVSDPALKTAKLPEGQTALFTSTSHIGNFLNAVRTGAPTICPAEVGRSSCDTCLIGNIAHRLGHSLEWDWRTRAFVNAQDADRFLWRENRGQWKNV